MKQTALDFLVPKTDATRARYKAGANPSFGYFAEDYMNGNVDVKGDFEEFMKSRNDFFKYYLTPHHFHFFLTRFIPEVVIHSKSQDERIIRDHYDRGNDFFAAFLGPRMVYTSGFFLDPKNETLEVAQDRKMQMVCNKLMLEKGESHLDIGCGWGTLIAYAAKNYGTDSTGVTIAQEGADWANQQIADHGLTSSQARALRLDYRDIPSGRKWNKISCLEMGEHVGIRKFGGFIKMIYDKLEDDGKFYIQQAGLRANPGLFVKGPHYQDLVWGLFMGENIFPGADASTPLAFLVSSLQNANFEVAHLENVGIHYSHTIHKWYYNWMRNEQYIMEHYGQRWFRMWQLFLRWSVDIAKQGNSTCWSITAHKNLDKTDRDRYIKDTNTGLRMDLTKPIKFEREYKGVWADLYGGAK
jgi:cyclopropane fatty-acyl-phospholipid synthase-like methyltransferase